MASSKAANAMSRSCLPAAIRAWKIAFSRLASVRCLGQGTLTVMVSSGTAASFLLGVERTLRALLGQVWDLTGGLAPGGRYRPPATSFRVPPSEDRMNGRIHRQRGARDVGQLTKEARTPGTRRFLKSASLLERGVRAAKHLAIARTS